MIISAIEARQHIETSLTDEALEAKLQGLELLIRKHTNNNFQKVNFRAVCPVESQKLSTDYGMFRVGDTVMISQSFYNDDLYQVMEIEGNYITLDKPLADEPRVVVTKVEYPLDVKMGVINMLKWDLENRDKVGIQSETISRHSVTYFNMDGDNSTMGFPRSLLGFLQPYKKARF